MRAVILLKLHGQEKRTWRIFSSRSWQLRLCGKAWLESRLATSATADVNVILLQGKKSQHPAGKLMSHLLERPGVIIEGRNERIDGRSSFRCQIHVSYMNAIQRCFAHTEHQRPFFFQAHIPSALNQVAGHSMSNSGQSSHAAGKDDH